MSLTSYTSDQFITVFMSTSLNEERLAEHPPLLRTEVSDEWRREDVETSVSRIAQYWDIYRDIVQLSIFHEGHANHFLLCDDPDRPAHGVFGYDREVEGSTVCIYDDEENLIKDFFKLLRDIYGPETHEGSPMYTHLMIGWRMFTEIWPILINRALKYRIPVYRDMLTSPDTKWPTSRHLSDISTLYVQGGGGYRKTPGLADMLRFWGFWEGEHRPMPEDIAKAVCEDPRGTADYVTLYLKDMYNAMCMYYNLPQDTTQDKHRLAGLAVPVPTILPGVSI